MKQSTYRDRDYAFGQMMLTLRTRIGLTQSGLAEYLGISRRAVGDWEAGSSYPKADHLKKFIGLAVQHQAFTTGQETAEIRALWQAARQKVLLDEAWLASLLVASVKPEAVRISVPIVPVTEIRYQPHSKESYSASLPFQATSFIGRGNEIGEITRMLGDPECRLLTLVGPGGIGKTRLALEVASSQSTLFSSGVVFVQLASVSTPDQVISAIGDALHVSFGTQADPRAHLLDYLQRRNMLLVLDNFEHVLEAADLISDIIQFAPYVTLLVTSRVHLDLQSEWLFDVEGLNYPDSDSSPDLAEYSAVQLFVQRAKRIQQNFLVTESNRETLVRICHHVAGMPLAIELAAAGLRTQPLEQIEQQLQKTLTELSTTLRDMPTRHRNMRAVFDRSFELLSEYERRLFCRLAVFRGGISLEAAEQVANATPFALTTLVENSLLRQSSYQAEVTADTRFSMLEPIRDYASEKLEALSETQATHRAHALYYLALVEQLTPLLDTASGDTATRQLDLELDNIRAALRWCCDSGEVTSGLRICNTMRSYWQRHGYHSEGRLWLQELLTLTEADPDPEAVSVRTRAIDTAAWLASDQHDYEQATLLYEQAADRRHTLGEAESVANPLGPAGRQARAVGDYAQALAIFETVVSRHRERQDRGSLSTGGLGLSLYELGLVVRELGDFPRAEALFNEALELHRELGDGEGYAVGLLGMGDIARDTANFARNRQFTGESMAVFRKLGIQWATGFALNNLSWAAFQEGDLGLAFSLNRQSVALFREIQGEGGLAEILITTGVILLAQGKFAKAQEALNESVKYSSAVGPLIMMTAGVETLGAVMAAAGHSAHAAKLLGLAAALRDQMGTPLRPIDRATVEPALEMTRSVLTPQQFNKLWAEAAKQGLAGVLSELPDLSLESTPKISYSLPAATQPEPSPQPAPRQPRVEWGNALAVPTFYGRDWETSLLKEWIVLEHCRVISILGLGGIGKSALAVSLMRQVADQFDVVIWRSLRDIPTCEALLNDLLQILAPHPMGSAGFQERMNSLLEYMRQTRVLIVLDNLESVLEEGANAGRMRPGYEGFSTFLRRSAESAHQSCVLLTSREKPSDLLPHEGKLAPVRTLRLARLDLEACEYILAESNVTGSSTAHARLIEAYAGNPLALKIVSRTIVDLFDGDIELFLEQGEVIFGGIKTLLDEQFQRLSQFEMSVVLWLTIMREPSTLDQLLIAMATPVTRARLLETIESLRMRSLIERGHQRGSFTLHSVVLEYMTDLGLDEAVREIQTGDLVYLLTHRIELAQSPEFVRIAQQQLIVHPLLMRLKSVYPQPGALEQRLKQLLNQFATGSIEKQDYGPANILSLLKMLRGNLRDLDLSHLTLRGIYLQGVDMQNANLSDTVLQDSVFTETFDSITHTAISRTGNYWAAASRNGEVRIWDKGGQVLHHIWRAHADIVCAIVFSPDGSTLTTSGSWDGTVKLWDVASGALLWSVTGLSQAYDLTFSPDGRIIASTEYNTSVRLWDASNGEPIISLPHPDQVCGVAWSPSGALLASGDLNGTIRLWDVSNIEQAYCTQTIPAHTNCVEALVFSPDSRMLASGSWDSTAKIWNVEQGTLHHTINRHTDRVTCVDWSPDGHIVASSGRDKTIWLWNIEHNTYQAALTGHTGGVYGLNFTPDSLHLFTGGEDGTLRVWDVVSNQCVRVIAGNATSLYDVDWSPDCSQLVSGGSDKLVTVFDASGEKAPQSLRGHNGFVIGVGWSADGKWLGSSEWNNAVRLWDPESGKCLHVLHHSDKAGDYLDSLNWSPDGHQLAVGSYTRGPQLFEIQELRQPWAGRHFQTWIRHVAWSPDGARLMGGGADGHIYIWDVKSGALVQQFVGHHSATTDVAWSADGTRIASASGGEIFVWDAYDGAHLHTFTGHAGIVYALEWGTGAERLISGGGDGTLRWWDVNSGECLLIREAHRGTVHSVTRSPDGTRLASCGSDGAIRIWDLQTGDNLRVLRRDRPYEHLNISGIRGLTDAQIETLKALGAAEY